MSVPSPLPPLAVRTLPFRALAALAARSPMGGEREVVLGCFMAARLAALVADGTAPRDRRAARATAARTWLGGLALPATLRTLFTAVIDDSAGDDRAALSRSVSALITAVSRFLDEPSRAELERLVERLAASVP